MGFIARWKRLNKPRASGSGKLWDNINTPGSVGPKGTTVTMFTEPTRLNTFVAGPNPEPYLKTAETKDPYRVRVPHRVVYPPIATREPTTDVGSGEIYINSQGAVANPKVLPKAQPLKTIAPSRTRIRDVEFDAGDPVRDLARFQTVTPSQRYFDERTPLPEFTTPSVPSHAVQAGNGGIYPTTMQRGWYQDYVPDPGMHFPQVGVSPPTLLSAPIRVETISRGGDGYRSAIKNAKAPKRQRSA
jgi:hypothetical protein